MSKKSNKYKKWKRDKKRIDKQKGLPYFEKRYGNIQDKCYTCSYAGLLFDKVKVQFIPYCCNKAHPGVLFNFSINKWNDNVDIREERYINALNKLKALKMYDKYVRRSNGKSRSGFNLNNRNVPIRKKSTK